MLKGVLCLQTIESERLVLRSLSEADVEDMYSYAAVPDVGPCAGWKPHANRAETLGLIRLFIAKDNVWGIERKSDRRLIGSLGIHTDKWRNLPDVCTFGYVLAKDYWGQGYMTEAVRRALAYAFTEAGMNLVSISHYTFNKRSRRVIEKCGFVYEGTIRRAFIRYDGAVFDESIYSLTKAEWQALPALTPQV